MSWLPAARNIWRCSGSITTSPFRSAVGAQRRPARETRAGPAPDRDIGRMALSPAGGSDDRADGSGRIRRLPIPAAGLKRRVFLARALVNDPDLLLLDEPTNHLDIATILWLEDFLLKYESTLMFVTHDRAFLRRLSTRIVEIDRGRLLSFACDYRTLLEAASGPAGGGREAMARFRQEACQGGSVDQAGRQGPPDPQRGQGAGIHADAQERAQRQEQEGVSRLVIREAERSGRMVVDAEDVSFSWGDKRDSRGFLHHDHPRRQGGYRRP